MPYVSTPDLDGVGRKHGMGDTNFLGFAVPKASPKKTVWGIGPAINIPTGGSDQFTGSGSWQLGPAAVVMVSPVKGLQVGALVFHQWDVYDIRSDAPDVSKTFIQPILTKHFDKGWYVSLPDTPQSYDWEEEDWTLNLGAVLGRVFPVMRTAHADLRRRLLQLGRQRRARRGMDVQVPARLVVPAVKQ